MSTRHRSSGAGQVGEVLLAGTLVHTIRTIVFEVGYNGRWRRLHELPDFWKSSWLGIQTRNFAEAPPRRKSPG